MPDTSWYCMPVCVLWSLGFSDFPGTTCGSWNCNPGCAGHTTNVCPPQWDFWALNVSGKAAWWPTNLAKYSEDNLWKKCIYYMKIDFKKIAWISFLILQLFTSLSLCCTCFLLFSTKKHTKRRSGSPSPPLWYWTCVAPSIETSLDSNTQTWPKSIHGPTACQNWRWAIYSIAK